MVLTNNSNVTILQGDCLETLKTLPSNYVQCVVTSPPYYGLRDYGVENQIGLENTPEAYVEKLVSVFREVRRVLRDDGLLWLNLGDSYAGSWGNYGGKNRGKGKQREILSGSKVDQKAYKGKEDWRPPTSNNLGNKIKPKDLIGIPWLVAFALRADGWYLRADVIWHKPNPLPESVKDRPTRSHEHIFMFSKSKNYYYDSESVKEPNAQDSRPTGSKINKGSKTRIGQGNNSKTSILTPGNMSRDEIKKKYYENGRNRRDVWKISTSPYKGAHFATFPAKLIEPCILSSSKAGDIVLDPFNGSGTTGEVSLKYGRMYIGCELNPAYIDLTYKRLSKIQIEFDQHGD